MIIGQQIVLPDMVEFELSLSPIQMSSEMKLAPAVAATGCARWKQYLEGKSFGFNVVVGLLDAKIAPLPKPELRHPGTQRLGSEGLLKFRGDDFGPRLAISVGESDWDELVKFLIGIGPRITVHAEIDRAVSTDTQWEISQIAFSKSGAAS